MGYVPTFNVHLGKNKFPSRQKKGFTSEKAPVPEWNNHLLCTNALPLEDTMTVIYKKSLFPNSIL